MNAQLIEDMPFEDYLAHPALSASGMKNLLDSPARFKHEKENPSDTPAMKLGRLIHAIALDQPHNFTVKDWDGRTTEGKARAIEVSERGLEVVSEDDWRVAQGITAAVRTNKLASKILYGDDPQHEVSAFWTDPDTGVELKCRYDTLQLTLGRIADLKSAPKARPEVFIRDAASYEYFVSAAHYKAGAVALGFKGDPAFFLVAAEKTRPHFVSVVGITDFDLELAERLRRKAIRIYADCVARNEWPDYSTDIAYPDAPSWWRYSVEEQTGLNEIEVA